jgi:peptidoglycan biosynthesis protein MviN/MurJ (putative lipid II flippase)
MVWAYTILNIVWLLVWQIYANKLIGVRFIDMLKDIVPFAVISIAVMAVTWYLTSFISNNWLLLIARIFIAAVLYAIIMKLLRVKMMEECLNFIRNKRKTND